MNVRRRGTGPPLVLVHGVGGSHRSWDPIADRLAVERELIAVDLPGHGETPPMPETSIATYADALEQTMDDEGVRGADMAGSSMGARLVLELARRGSSGNVVALDPGGFWTRREQWVFGTSVKASVALLRRIEPLLPALAASPAGRTLLLGQFSARPWALDGGIVLSELRSFARAPSFDAALHALAHGPAQAGATVTPGRVVVGWGARDLVTLPRQARTLRQRFPMTELEMYPGCGHFPFWDAPDRAVATILGGTGTALTSPRPRTR